MKRVQKERALDILYAELPSIECTGRCHPSCGPIPVTPIEWARIRRNSAVAREAEVLDTPFATFLQTDDALTCPLLKDKRCLVYRIRPLICRLYGVVDDMPCRWGCVPSRMLTKDEGYDFLRRAREIEAA